MPPHINRPTPNFTAEFISYLLAMEKDEKIVLHMGKQHVNQSTDCFWLYDLNGSSVFHCSNRELFFKKVRSIAEEMGVISKPTRCIEVSIRVNIYLDPKDGRNADEVVSELTEGIMYLQDVHSVVSVEVSDSMINF